MRSSATCARVAAGVPTCIASWAFFVCWSSSELNDGLGEYGRQAERVEDLRYQQQLHSWPGRQDELRVGAGSVCPDAKAGLTAELNLAEPIVSFATPGEATPRSLVDGQRAGRSTRHTRLRSDGDAEWSAGQQGSTPSPAPGPPRGPSNLNNARVVKTELFLRGCSQAPTALLPTSTRGVGTPGAFSPGVQGRRAA